MITVFKYIPEHVEGTPSNVNNFSIIEVRTDRIGIFDYEGKLQHVISGVNIRHVHF
jgi:NADH:ubiquinone oxidoreductase subunit D